MTSLFVSEREAAEMLGHSVDWFRKNREDLERQFGFPKIDPATGKRHLPSIERWASERNNVVNGSDSAAEKRIGNLDRI